MQETRMGRIGAVCLFYLSILSMRAGNIRPVPPIGVVLGDIPGTAAMDVETCIPDDLRNVEFPAMDEPSMGLIYAVDAWRSGESRNATESGPPACSSDQHEFGMDRREKTTWK